MQIAHPTPSWVHEAKEHHDQSKSQSRIQGSAHCHCVLAPPLTSSSPDDTVEDEAYHSPDAEVQPGRGWDPAETPKQNRQVDLAPNGISRLVATDEPDQDRCDEAD